MNLFDETIMRNAWTQRFHDSKFIADVLQQRYAGLQT